MKTRQVLIVLWALFLCTKAIQSEPKIVEAENEENNVDVKKYQIGPNNISRFRQFTIDYDRDTFQMDGKPFQFIAGSIHYFRVPHEYWRDRIRAMKAAGLNTITTYVEWSFHEPEYREYSWIGDKDLIKFIEIITEEGLYINLRPGPYICAERDMGGFPYWLLTKYPNIKLRTKDEDYKREVQGWYSELMTKMQPYLYGNGGNIIMVQVENEYGSYAACDKEYTSWLARLTEDWVRGAAVLYTTDGPNDRMLSCGSIPGVYATVDFGPGTNVTSAWEMMRRYSPKGPLVNSEYYPGWLTHWGEPMASVTSAAVVNTLDKMLKVKGNVNFYMFYGGTNFGFSAGANLSPEYVADITSYDYDAPLTEAGDPTTKYFEIRAKIGEYFQLPDTPVPVPTPKGNYGLLELKPFTNLMSPFGRSRLGKKVWHNKIPQTMEALQQHSGLLLYESALPDGLWDPSLLTVTDLKDRALVYINQTLVGILSRSRKINSIPFMPAMGSYLQILVENQGRVNYGLAEDYKGIKDEILVNGRPLYNWTMTNYPLDDFEWAAQQSQLQSNGILDDIDSSDILKSGPAVFIKNFKIIEDNMDTFVDMSGWGKGYVWINNRNLGRYWPNEGPQVTLYLPGVYLNPKPDSNTIVVLEMEHVPKNRSIKLVNEPNLGTDKNYKWR